MHKCVERARLRLCANVVVGRRDRFRIIVGGGCNPLLDNAVHTMHILNHCHKRTPCKLWWRQVVFGRVYVD
jgi:hypothetical protein